MEIAPSLLNIDFFECLGGRVYCIGQTRVCFLMESLINMGSIILEP